jgi:hypothetical protein
LKRTVAIGPSILRSKSLRRIIFAMARFAGDHAG